MFSMTAQPVLERCFEEEQVAGTKSPFPQRDINSETRRQTGADKVIAELQTHTRGTLRFLHLVQFAADHLTACELKVISRSPSLSGSARNSIFSSCCSAVSPLGGFEARAGQEDSG